VHIKYYQKKYHHSPGLTPTGNFPSGCPTYVGTAFKTGSV